MYFNSHVIPACEAITSSYGLFLEKDLEDGAQQGRNLNLAALQQFGQSIFLVSQMNKLKEATQSLFVSNAVQIGLSLAGPLLAGVITLEGKYIKKETCFLSLGNKKVTWLHIRKGIVWLNQNLGSFYQVTSLVTNVALLYLGHHAYAIPSLTILSIGYLNRRNCLNQTFRKIYLTVTPYIATIGVIFSESYLEKVITVINLTDSILRWQFPKKIMKPYDEVQHLHHLTYGQFEQVFTTNPVSPRKVDIEINRDHIWVAPFPVVKNIDFKPLEELVESFNWSNNEVFSFLEKALEQDARWPGSDEFLLSLEASESEVKSLKIQYAKRKIYILIKSIREEQIETKAPLNYGMLRNYLAYIAEKLPGTDFDQKKQLLIRLALEGGDYCGPGIYQQLEKIAVALCYNKADSRLPLKQRLLLILQQERLRIMEGFHEQVFPSIHPYFHHLLFGGTKDVHAFEFTVQAFGFDFGLPNQGPEGNMIGEVSYLDKYIYRQFSSLPADFLWTELAFNRLIETSFVNRTKTVKPDNFIGYTQDRIKKTIKDEIGSPLIPKTDIYHWAQEWINQTSATEEQKESFLDKLQDGVSFENFKSNFEYSFIQAMLVDMGVFKIRPC